MLASGVGQLGRKRTRADTRRIRLCDAEHVVEPLRGHACARRCRTRHRIARRHVRIRAVIDIEQRTLRALEQQPCAAGHHAVQLVRDVDDQRPQAIGQCERVVDHLARLDTARAEVVLQHKVVQVERFTHAVGKARGIEQILRAYRTSRDLVLVRGTDATAGRADLRRTTLDLARLDQARRDTRVSTGSCR